MQAMRKEGGMTDKFVVICFIATILFFGFIFNLIAEYKYSRLHPYYPNLSKWEFVFGNNMYIVPPETNKEKK